MNYTSGKEEEFVAALSVEGLKELGQTIIDRLNDELETLGLSRCPVCNKSIGKAMNYKPSWVQVKVCIEIIRILASGHKHVHIKDGPTYAVRGHENHTVTDAASNNQAKMRYLGLIAYCDEDGNIGDPDDPDNDVRRGRYACRTITKSGYDFVMGKSPLIPGVVRVKNDQVIEVPENRHIAKWVSEIDGYEEDGWKDSVSKHSLVFPEDLMPDAQAVLPFMQG